MKMRTLLIAEWLSWHARIAHCATWCTGNWEYLRIEVEVSRPSSSEQEHELRNVLRVVTMLCCVVVVVCCVVVVVCSYVCCEILWWWCRVCVRARGRAHAPPHPLLLPI